MYKTTQHWQNLSFPWFDITQWRSTECSEINLNALQTLALHGTGQLTTHCHCLTLVHYITLLAASCHHFSLCPHPHLAPSYPQTQVWVRSWIGLNVAAANKLLSLLPYWESNCSHLGHQQCIWTIKSISVNKQSCCYDRVLLNISKCSSRNML